MIDTLTLVREQSRENRMALALSQSFLRPLNLCRKLLPPKTHRGVPVGILIEFPRNQLMYLNLRRTQDFASAVCTEQEGALVCELHSSRISSAPTRYLRTIQAAHTAPYGARLG